MPLSIIKLTPGGVIKSLFSIPLLFTFANTCHAQPKEIRLKDVGSFHIGGERVTLSGLPVKEVQAVAGGPVRKSDPNGDYQVGQMYVQYMLQANPVSNYPMMFWHGGGMTGVTWETKPDGQPGWHAFFLRAGFDTYVSDAVERGRSSWARYPEIVKSEPEHRTQNAGWNMFRIGPADGYHSEPAQRVAYQGERFPVAYWDQFWKQSVARWTTSNTMTLAAYRQLIDKVGPSILVAHSQGAAFALTTAQNEPSRFKALVLLEPSGAPDPEKVDVAQVKDVKFLVFWGDYIAESPLWSTYRANVEKYLTAVKNAGGSVEYIDLPARGVKGNTHLLMMDNNSDELAQMTFDWLKQQKLLKP